METSIKSSRKQAKYAGVLATAQHFAAPSASPHYANSAERPTLDRQVANYFSYFHVFGYYSNIYSAVEHDK